MKRGSTIFLRAVILFIAVVALAGMVRFPLTEGRAVNLSLLGIYSDPFIVYGYVASIPFFVALYQAFKFLGHIGQDKVFSPSSVDALRTIKYCAIAIAGFMVVGMIYLTITMSGKEDLGGPNAMGIFVAFASVVIAAALAVFEEILQSGVDIKSENDRVKEDSISSDLINKRA